MSHTDKTRPWWVQVLDPNNRGWAEEDHDHRNGICDLENVTCNDIREPDARVSLQTLRFLMGWHHTDCRINYSTYGYHQNMWRCRPRYRGRWRNGERDGRARAELRRLKVKWLREPIHEDIDSTENLPNEKWLWHKWRD